MTERKDKLSPGEWVFMSTAEALYRRKFGVLDPSFLAQRVSCLPHRDPICLPEDATVHAVMRKLQVHRVGCVLITDEQGKLCGIFSERDFVLKVYGSEINPREIPVREVMTSNPITQPPDATFAHVLNLMSNGGFRHIPIIEEDGEPFGVVSVKDIMDHIVSSVSESLLDFETRS